VPLKSTGHRVICTLPDGTEDEIPNSNDRRRECKGKVVVDGESAKEKAAAVAAGYFLSTLLMSPGQSKTTK